MTESSEETSEIVVLAGYQGSFKKRTRAMRDGCATFFKKSSFECEAVIPVEYFVPDIVSLDRDNIALLLLLQPKYHVPHTEEQSRLAKLCVANTHLLFNPRRGDVKLAQLMKLLAEIDRLTYQPCPAGPCHRNHCPVLICGDMNMEPFSHLYKFLHGGKLALVGQPAAKLSGQERKWSCGYRRPITAGFLGRRAGLTDQCQYVSVCQQRFNKTPSRTDGTVTIDVDCETASSSHMEPMTSHPEPVPSDTEPMTSNREPVPCTNTNYAQTGIIFTQGCGIVSHKFGLDSVYAHFLTQDDGRGHHRHKLAREVTTCHMLANCTVDYIFYTPSVSDANHSENDCVANSAPQTMLGPSPDDSASDEHHHKLPALSAAALLAGNNESVSSIPQQSSVSNAACEVINYKLTLLARLQLLSDKEMKQIGQLPNKFISSDHLILAAQFQLTSG